MTTPTENTTIEAPAQTILNELCKAVMGQDHHWYGESSFLKDPDKYLSPLPPLPEIKPYYEGADFKKSASKYLTAEQEHQWFMEYNYAKRQHSESRIAHLRDFLTRCNIAMMYAMVSRYSVQFEINWDDALSECQEKFLMAIDGFNPMIGLKFSTYVCRIMFNAMQAMKKKETEQRDQKVKWQQRKNDRTELVTGLSTMIQGEDMPVEKLKAALFKNEAGLTPRERVVLIHRFGLTGQPTKKLTDVGAQLGISREYVRQIEMDGIEKLKEFFGVITEEQEMAA